jgi:Dolichyl-phosphate-mannose-protein mannosyltransferase
MKETQLNPHHRSYLSWTRRSWPWRRLDRPLCLVLLIAAAIVVPRSYLITRAHSEAFDDTYHLKRGLAFLTRSLASSDLELNDPPLGEGIVAVPMLVTNLLEGRDPGDDRFYDAPNRAETIAIRIALWNSILFVGFLGVVFGWCRQIYGPRSGFVAVALFLVDPNFAAHVPIAALDVVGVEGIVVACLLVWRYFDRPTVPRLVAMGFGLAFALMLKHTAVVLPLVIACAAGLHWVVRPWFARQSWDAWRLAFVKRVRTFALLGLIVPAAIWSLSLFDCSAPLSHDAVVRQSIGAGGGSVSRGKAIRVALERSLHFDGPWPAGCYLRAFRLGMGHGMSGHQSYLNGEHRETGWWSYYPIVASYKVPIGIGVVFLLAILSLRGVPPRWAECELLVPMLAWTLFAMSSKVNLGFRHFFPAYAFMLMLASRCVVSQASRWSALAWAGIAAAAIHGLAYHPDYLCYMNAPRTKPYLAISDCNVDWGQSLKQVRAWLDEHPQGKRKVSFFYFGKETGGTIEYYLNDRVTALDQYSPRPTEGLLMISPVRLAGVYELADPYAALRAHEPEAVIGNSILVFDLDRLGQGKPFCWPPIVATEPPADTVMQ